MYLGSIYLSFIHKHTQLVELVFLPTYLVSHQCLCTYLGPTYLLPYPTLRALKTRRRHLSDVIFIQFLINSPFIGIRRVIDGRRILGNYGGSYFYDSCE